MRGGVLRTRPFNPVSGSDTTRLSFCLHSGSGEGVLAYVVSLSSLAHVPDTHAPTPCATSTSFSPSLQLVHMAGVVTGRMVASPLQSAHVSWHVQPSTRSCCSSRHVPAQSDRGQP